MTRTDIAPSTARMRPFARKACVNVEFAGQQPRIHYPRHIRCLAPAIPLRTGNTKTSNGRGQLVRREKLFYNCSKPTMPATWKCFFYDGYEALPFYGKESKLRIRTANIARYNHRP